MGSMINSGNQQYYYHDQGWSDMNGAYHQSGYYSPQGYHYSSPQEFGYCPQFSEPGYVANCGTGGNGDSSGSSVAIVLVICCCCCCIAAAFSNNNKDKNQSRPLYDEQEMEDDNGGDVTTFQGEDIPRGDAIAFLQAVEAEHVDGVEGEVGEMFDRRKFLPEVTERLACEEERIAESDDRERAVIDLADRWGMRNAINH